MRNSKKKEARYIYFLADNEPKQIQQSILFAPPQSTYISTTICSREQIAIRAPQRWRQSRHAEVKRLRWTRPHESLPQVLWTELHNRLRIGWIRKLIIVVINNNNNDVYCMQICCKMLSRMGALKSIHSAYQCLLILTAMIVLWLYPWANKLVRLGWEIGKWPRQQSAASLHEMPRSSPTMLLRGMLVL